MTQRDVASPTMDDLAEVLGRAYHAGPFAVPHRCRIITTILRQPELSYVHAVDEHAARCSRCGRMWTVHRLRRLVLEDPVLGRRLRLIRGGGT